MKADPSQSFSPRKDAINIQNRGGPKKLARRASQSHEEGASLAKVQYSFWEETRAKYGQSRVGGEGERKREISREAIVVGAARGGDTRPTKRS